MQVRYIILVELDPSFIIPADLNDFYDESAIANCKKYTIDEVKMIVRKYLANQMEYPFYIIDSDTYSEYFNKFHLQIPFSLLKGNVIKPERHLPFQPISENYFSQVAPIIERMGIHLSNKDVRNMLHHGRSSLLCDSFKLSVDIDDNCIVSLNVHTKKHDHPVIPKIMKSINPDTGLLVNHYVAYDKDLHEVVKIPCEYIFIPAKLYGIKLSFRQRKFLKLGRRVILQKQFSAQVNAVNRNIEIKILSRK